MTTERIAYTELSTGAIDDFPTSNDNIILEAPTATEQDEEYLTGEYEYESDAMFGTPTTFDARYIYHSPTRMLGLVMPGAGFDRVHSVFDHVDDLVGTEGIPDITPADTHALYNDHGTGAYSVRFTDDLQSYALGDRAGITYNPERVAEDHAQETPGITVSPEYITELIEDAMDDDMYVSSARLQLMGDESTSYEAPTAIVTGNTDVTDLIELTDEVIIEYLVSDA